MTRKIVFILVLVFCPFLFLELALAFFLPAPSFEKIIITCGDENEYELSPNRKLIYAPRPGTGEFNSQGYRGMEFPVERKKGEKRVLIFGDSVAEGLGVTPVERFSAILNGMLGENYEVINLAVRGYNLVQEIEYLKEKGLKYCPDAVIFCITYNDLQVHSGEITVLDDRMKKIRESVLYKAYYSAQGKLDGALLNLNMYRYIRCFGLRDKTFYESIAYYVDRDHLVSLVNETKRLSVENNFRLSFIFLPVYGGTEQMDQIKAAVAEMQIPYLDINRQIYSEAGPGGAGRFLMKNDPCHLNIEGHRVVSDVIYGNLYRLIPGW